MEGSGLAGVDVRDESNIAKRGSRHGTRKGTAPSGQGRPRYVSLLVSCPGAK